MLILRGQYNQNVRLSDISMIPEKTWVVSIQFDNVHIKAQVYYDFPMARSSRMK